MTPTLMYTANFFRSKLSKSLLATPLVIGAFAANNALAAGTIKISEESNISIGAGIRTQLTFAEDGAPDGDSTSTDLDIGNLRLYVNGQVNDTVKFTVNTDRIDGEIDILDAIARFEFNEYFNVWAGLMLTPADRIEMNGPFYGLSWNQYTQPLFASDQDNPNDDVEGQAGTFGRDTGITIWGSADKFQYAFGLFDGVENGPNQSDNPLFAARIAYNFLNKEDNPGYYTSSTYHGGLGNIFTLGASFQSQSEGVGNALESGDFTGFTVDLLSETVLAGGNVLTIEAEYKDFSSDFTSLSSPELLTENQTLSSCEGPDGFCLFDGDSYFVTAAYMFKNKSTGDFSGDFQPYIRFVSNNPSDGNDSDLTELGLNYIIKGHNARLNLNYSTGDANISGFQGGDVDVLSFGIQIQI